MRIFLMTPVGVVVTTRGRERVKIQRNLVCKGIFCILQNNKEITKLQTQIVKNIGERGSQSKETSMYKFLMARVCSVSQIFRTETDGQSDQQTNRPTNGQKITKCHVNLKGNFFCQAALLFTHGWSSITKYMQTHIEPYHQISTLDIEEYLELISNKIVLV